MHVARAVIAKEMVKLGQSLGDIAAAVLVDDIQAFPGMCVEETEVPVGQSSGSARKNHESKKQEQKESTNSQNARTSNFRFRTVFPVYQPIRASGQRELGDFAHTPGIPNFPYAFFCKDLDSHGCGARNAVLKTKQIQKGWLA